ncbi:MAG TPA: DUF2167 domain-containing protein [Methylocystis sp.]
MSLSKPPVAASSVALLAVLSLVPSAGSARDGRRAGEDVVHEIAPMSSNSTHEIIFEMAPLKPVKSAAQAAKPAPKPVERPAPAIAAPKPETAPAPPVAAPQSGPASVAEAQKPAEAPALALEGPKPAEAQLAPEQPAAPEGRSVAAESQAPAAASPADQAPPEPSVAQAPLVEPAPIGAPIMVLNGLGAELADLKEPVPALHGSGVDIQDGSEAPGFVPRLDSLAQAGPPQVEDPHANVADAQEPAPMPLEAAASEEMQESGETGARADSDLEARIRAILAEGLVGPTDVRIADRATLWLPAGRAFLPLEAARKLAKEAGMEWRAGVQGMIAPAGDKLEWLAPVELLDDGHIPTGEAGALQPDQLLTAFQTSLPEINARRAGTGVPPVTLEGWLVPPALDAKRRLSACVDISIGNGKGGRDHFFNCEAWALGRDGAIKVGLADAGEMAQGLKDEAAALAGAISFDHGKGYDDFDASADRVAPYTVADLLTRDVGAQTPKPVPTPQERAETPTILDGLLQPAALALAAIGLYFFVKRRRQEKKVEEAQAQPAASEAAGAETGPAEAQAPASLFARLLPPLHRHFAKKGEQASQQAPAMETPAKSILGALRSRLTAARRSVKKEDAAPAPVSAPAPASSVAVAEEPVSALKKLAARMRRAQEPAAPAPNVARVIRPARALSGGAAPALVEALPGPLTVGQGSEQAATGAVAQLELIEPGQKASPAAAEPADHFGLIEPGDADATDVAINASRARLASDR